jgi:medium-chain acyl-[acyl-carrier-protein] hydrolase
MNEKIETQTHPNITTSTYQIRLDEVDKLHQLTLPALVGYLQEIAWKASEYAKVPIPILLEQNLTWILSRMQIEIFEIPKYGQQVSFQTWAARFDKFLVQRDFRVVDEFQNVLVQASSNWLIVDTQKKKLIAIPDFIKEALQVNHWDSVFPFLNPKIEEATNADATYQLCVRWHDLDQNEHTNNKNYFRWLLDALPNTVLAQRKLKHLDIQFKLESKLDDNLLVQYAQENKNKFLHKITHSETQKELIRAVSVWE